jgi:hypothetical protein
MRKNGKGCVDIGSRSFRTQSSALEHHKSVLHRYQDGQRVSDQGDHADLVALVERYDPVLDAVGEPTKGDGQIAHFKRRLNTGTGWSSSGFWVVRQDGTATDFSYIDAVKGKPKGRSQDFYGACRQAVALDLIQAKKQAFAQYGDDQGRVECELTGVMVSIDNTHLDHAWPNFSHLVSGFRAARGWSRDIPDGVVSAPADGQMTANFVDSAVADAFRTYQHDQAMLRILSRTANLQTANQARRPRVARLRPSSGRPGSRAMRRHPCFQESPESGLLRRALGLGPAPRPISRSFFSAPSIVVTTDSGSAFVGLTNRPKRATTCSCWVSDSSEPIWPISWCRFMAISSMDWVKAPDGSLFYRYTGETRL